MYTGYLGGMTIDWTKDATDDLLACLTDYTRGAELAPNTPNGDFLAEQCVAIRAEFARRGLNVTRVDR